MCKLMCVVAIIGFALMLFGFGFKLAGCDGTSYEDAPDKDNTWISHGNNVATKVVTIEGHRYVILDRYYSSGIIHAESCGCKK